MMYIGPSELKGWGVMLEVPSLSPKPIDCASEPKKEKKKKRIRV